MASSSTSLSFSLILLLSLLSFSSAQTITRAAAILSDSGFKSMSRALDLAADSLDSQPPSLTVFAPADSAFAAADQPTPELLRFHLLPVAFPLRSLKSLPFGAKIATLLDGSSLAVTNFPADRLVSLNNVTVAAAPIYDDGDLIIFGIDRFFDRDFQISGSIGTRTPKILGCVAPRNPNEATADETAAFDPFREASEVLRSKGCAVMASFLEMQFLGFVKSQTMLTVLAPVDQVMIGDLSQYSSVLRRHVVPCRLSWSDLKSLEDGSQLRTDLQGFAINVSRNDSVLELNGVSVIMPEMYQNEWLVVHGISEVLELPQSPIESPTEPKPVVASPPQSQAVGRRSDEAVCFPGEVICFKDWFIVGMFLGFVLMYFFRV